LDEVKNEQFKSNYIYCDSIDKLNETDNYCDPNASLKDDSLVFITFDKDENIKTRQNTHKDPYDNVHSFVKGKLKVIHLDPHLKILALTNLLLTCFLMCQILMRKSG
jgi:hypothetical protein